MRALPFGRCGVFLSALCSLLPASAASAASAGEAAISNDADAGCVDVHSDCYERAMRGDCSEEPFYMLQNCKLSCRVCQRECVDRDAQCYSRGAVGECAKNPAFMLQNCYATCMCGADNRDAPCLDIAFEGSRQCRLWAWHDECDKNPEFMHRQCRKSCGLCTDTKAVEPPCEDDPVYNCQKWAEEDNFCDGNWRAKMNPTSEYIIDPNFVIEFCPVSCGVCDVHLDDRDMSLGIGLPQTYPDTDNAKEVRNKVRRRVAKIKDYIESLPSDVQKYCKLGHEMCARIAASEECEEHKDDILLKYGCAAACGTCEDLAKDQMDITSANVYYERAMRDYLEKANKIVTESVEVPVL